MSTSYEEYVQKLEEKIGLHTETPQYHAFADLADYTNSAHEYDSSKDAHGNSNIERALDKAAIWERIRQRRNEPTGFKGYKAAFSAFQTELGQLLLHPVNKDLHQSSRDKKVAADLQRIKNKPID